MGFLGLFDCFKRRSKRKGPAGAAAYAAQPSAYQARQPSLLSVSALTSLKYADSTPVSLAT